MPAKILKCSSNFGLYKNQISVRPPDEWQSRKKFFSLDPCIAGEVVGLIAQGIRTVASCCGHGRIAPTIIVATYSDRQAMLELGYYPYKGKCAALHVFEAKSHCCRESQFMKINAPASMTATQEVNNEII